MAKRINISDIIAYHRAHIIAVDENSTLFQWRPNMPLGIDSGKVAALRHAICNFETVPWRTCNLEMSRADLEESVMETKALLRHYGSPRTQE